MVEANAFQEKKWSRMFRIYSNMSGIVTGRGDWGVDSHREKAWEDNGDSHIHVEERGLRKASADLWLQGVIAANMAIVW